MSQDDQVPLVDPDNEKGKLEIGWIVAIAVALVVLAFVALRLTGRPAPPQRGLVVGPNNATTSGSVAHGASNSAVPAH